MHNRMPSRRRQAPGSTPGRQGNTVPVRAGDPSAQRVGQAVYDDLQRGQVDTDKGPAMDAAYDKLRKGAKDPVKKFRP